MSINASDPTFRHYGLETYDFSTGLARICSGPKMQSMILEGSVFAKSDHRGTVWLRRDDGGLESAEDTFRRALDAGRHKAQLYVFYTDTQPIRLSSRDRADTLFYGFKELTGVKWFEGGVGWPQIYPFYTPETFSAWRQNLDVTDITELHWTVWVP